MTNLKADRGTSARDRTRAWLEYFHCWMTGINWSDTDFLAMYLEPLTSKSEWVGEPGNGFFRVSVSVHFCICVSLFVHLCICGSVYLCSLLTGEFVFVYLCICVFVYLCICVFALGKVIALDRGIVQADERPHTCASTLPLTTRISPPFELSSLHIFLFFRSPCC